MSTSSRGALNRRMMVRLVKGAYWDTEIKRAQERGLDDYPVFTPQGDDRSELRRLRAKTAGAAAANFPAIRDPQCADGRDRSRTGRWRRRFRVSAPARHGRSALRAIERGSSRRWPTGPMRRSAATAISWPIWCGACWRTAPIPRSWRSPPTMRCRSQRCCGARPISSARAENARHPQHPRCPRDLYQPQRKNSRGIEFGDRAALNELLSAVAAETAPVAAASLIDGQTGAGAARAIVSPIDQTTQSEALSKRRPRTRTRR